MSRIYSYCSLSGELARTMALIVATSRRMLPAASIRKKRSKGWRKNSRAAALEERGFISLFNKK
jgi:hypothetical protein